VSTPATEAGRALLVSLQLAQMSRPPAPLSVMVERITEAILAIEAEAAALAHDRPSGSALSGSSAPEASKALTDAIHEIAQCHEALEYAAGFMADPEGLMHRREAWLAKVNAVLAARLRPSASDDAEVTEAKPETPAHSPWRHMTPSEWDAAGRPPKPEIPA